MSAVAEQADLLSSIRRASPESRRVVMQTLIETFLEDTKYLPQPIHNAKGELVGLFVPQYQSKATELPQFTPAEWEEMNRRFDTPEDSVSPEEFLKLLESEDARQRQAQ